MVLEKVQQISILPKKTMARPSGAPRSSRKATANPI